MTGKQKRNWPNFFLGLFVALVPFLGLPLRLQTVLLAVCGLLIALFSLVPLARVSELNQDGNS